MPSKQSKHVWRTLLTEVHPFELPLVFTNDIRYNYLNSEANLDEREKQILKGLKHPRCAESQNYTKPYCFSIKKGRSSKNTLSLIHPNSQIDVALFYDEFAEAIIENCFSTGRSLRFPHSIAKLYTPNHLIAEEQIDGPVIQSPEPEEIDTEKLASYFSYKDFNLLTKFHDSKEYVRLEKAFPTLRKLDISRCFYNIYTHSVTWCIKNKAFAKKFANYLSFEQRFDKLMQSLNYNETNGIVVGPEISRIFAEIILASVDDQAISELQQKNQLLEFNDFQIRRYIDDYYIYARSEDIADCVESVISKKLEDVKLFLNTEKRECLKRPYVTQIGLAKRDVRLALNNLSDSMRIAQDNPTVDSLIDVAKSIRFQTRECRSILAQYQVGFHTVSGWSLGVIRSMIYALLSLYGNDPDNSKKTVEIEKGLVSLLELAFYITHLDCRVSTTYALASIVLLSSDKRWRQISLQSEWLRHTLEKELIELLTYADSEDSLSGENEESIELYNIMILSAYVCGKEITNNEHFRNVISRLTAIDDIRYFRYISTKFCMLKNSELYADPIKRLDLRAFNKVIKNKKSLSLDSEIYHLACDLLGSATIENNAKRVLWKHICGDTLSNSLIAEVSAKCGFVDWNSVNLRKRLKRKRLRPIYE